VSPSGPSAMKESRVVEGFWSVPSSEPHAAPVASRQASRTTVTPRIMARRLALGAFSFLAICKSKRPALLSARRSTRAQPGRVEAVHLARPGSAAPLLRQPERLRNPGDGSSCIPPASDSVTARCRLASRAPSGPPPAARGHTTGLAARAAGPAAAAAAASSRSGPLADPLIRVVHGKGSWERSPTRRAGGAPLALARKAPCADGVHESARG
jgi:hypothetical protein